MANSDVPSLIIKTDDFTDLTPLKEFVSQFIPGGRIIAGTPRSAQPDADQALAISRPNKPPYYMIVRKAPEEGGWMFIGFDKDYLEPKPVEAAG